MNPKTYLRMLLVAVLFAAVACSDGDDPTPIPDPQTFRIEITEVSATGATVSVEYADPTAHFYADVMSREVYEYWAERGFGSYLSGYIDYLMKTEEISREQVLARIISTGSDDFTLFDLTPGTRYYAVALLTDADGIYLGETASEAFDTTAVAPSDNTFAITVSNIGYDGADIAVDPGNDDPYFCAVCPAGLRDSMDDDELIRHLSAFYTNTGMMEQMCTSGRLVRENEGACKPGFDYCVVVFGWQDGGATTGLTEKRFSTLRGGDPAECSFAFDIDAITSSGASVTVTPSDEHTVYYWDVIDDETYGLFVGEFGEEAMTECLEETIALYAEELGTVYEAVDMVGVYGTDSYGFRLSASTTYRVWAVCIDEAGNALSPVALSAPFTTPATVVASATAAAENIVYYDGDDFYALDPVKYADAKGFAVVVAEIVHSADAAHWYVDLFGGDLTEEPEETVIANLKRTLWVDCDEFVALAYWDDNTLFAVAEDADGNCGETFRRLVACSKEKALPLSELTASAAERSARLAAPDRTAGNGYRPHRTAGSTLRGRTETKQISTTNNR